MITLYTLQTKSICFAISTEESTFEFSYKAYGFAYQLLADGEWIAEYDSPHKAMNEVAERRTGVYEWDTKKLKTPLEPKSWNCQFDDQLRFKVVGDFLAKSPDLSYRGIDTYFHVKRPYLMDRMKLYSILEELAVSGQIDKEISEEFAPSEFYGLNEQLSRWRKTDQEPSE